MPDAPFRLNDARPAVTSSLIFEDDGRCDAPTSSHANRVCVLDRFIADGRFKPRVRFTRKDEIARYALETQGCLTPVIHRGPPTQTGLPGPTA